MERLANPGLFQALAPLEGAFEVILHLACFQGEQELESGRTERAPALERVVLVASAEDRHVDGFAWHWQPR
jgi:hypothetical protein